MIKSDAGEVARRTASLEKDGRKSREGTPEKGNTSKIKAELQAAENKEMPGTYRASVPGLMYSLDLTAGSSSSPPLITPPFAIRSNDKPPPPTTSSSRPNRQAQADLHLSSSSSDDPAHSYASLGVTVDPFDPLFGRLEELRKNMSGAVAFATLPLNMSKLQMKSRDPDDGFVILPKSSS